MKKKKKINKTALAISTELSYDKLVRYLDWMSKKGWVIVDVNGSVTLTKAGSEIYEELVQWIVKHIGQLKFPRLRATT